MHIYIYNRYIYIHNTYISLYSYMAYGVSVLYHILYMFTLALPQLAPKALRHFAASLSSGALLGPPGWVRKLGLADLLGVG